MSSRVPRIGIVLMAAIVIGTAACSKSAEAPPASASQQATSGGAPALQSAHAPMVADPGAAAPHGDGAGSPHGMLSWDTPAAWTQEQPSNPMRMAQYRVPASAGDAADGECVVFYFGPGQGGDAPANVARWMSMFSTPTGEPVQGKVSEQKLGDKLVTRIEASGTYQPTAMMMGGAQPAEQPGSMLLGAIVPGADANWFFRCIGPEKTIAANRTAFDGFIASVK
jgi:gluconolactonase